MTWQLNEGEIIPPLVPLRSPWSWAYDMAAILIVIVAWCSPFIFLLFAWMPLTGVSW
jgi:hypothetical protein